MASLAFFKVRLMKNFFTKIVLAVCVLHSLFFIVSCSSIQIPFPLEHSASDWSMAGKNTSRTSFDSTSVVRPPFQLLWQYDATAGFGNSALTVVDSVVFFGTLQGELYAISALTGKRFGYLKTHSSISGAPVIFKNNIYFGTETGKENFISYDVKDGSERWSKNIGGVTASPLLYNGKIFIGGGDGTLYCFDPLDGAAQWKYETGVPIFSSACAEHSLVFAANTKGTIFALHEKNGTCVWKQEIHSSIMSGLTVKNGILYFGARDNFLYAVDALNGSVLWKYNAGAKIMSTPALNDSLVVVSSLNGMVHALSLRDGTARWTFQAKSAVNTTPAITPTAIIVASLDTRMYVLSPQDGSVLWSYEIGSRIKTSPIVWGNRILIAAEDKIVYCFISSP